MSYGYKHSIAFKSGTFSVFWKIKIKIFDTSVVEALLQRPTSVPQRAKKQKPLRSNTLRLRLWQLEKD